MTPDYVIAVVGASLLGSAHCAAMCGGLVSAVSFSGPGRNRRPSALGFHVGRLVTYGALGALAGWLGHAVDMVGNYAGMVDAAAILAGSLVAAAGLATLLSTTTPFRLEVPSRLSALPRWLSEQLGKRLGARAARGTPTVFLLGLSSGLLPCGWLYAFVLAAAGTASALYGALLMLAFWLGTVPALLTLGAIVKRLSTPLRRHLPLLSAALLVVVGLSTILFRINIPALALSNTEAAVLGASAPTPARLPCH